MDLDPTDPSLAASDARLAAVAALDAAGRGDPVGWVIPLHPVAGARTGDRPDWVTTHWTLRRGHLVLIPGDSPMGARLPLESLTWQPPPPADPEPSSFREHSPLPDQESADDLIGQFSQQPHRQRSSPIEDAERWIAAHMEFMTGSFVITFAMRDALNFGHVETDVARTGWVLAGEAPGQGRKTNSDKRDYDGGGD